MHPFRAIASAGLIAAVSVGLGACGDGASSEETTSSTPVASSSTGSAAEIAAVEGVFDTYWRVTNAMNPSRPPSKEFKSVVSDKAYKDAAASADKYPKLAVKGKDELVASEARVTSETEATVEVCYEVHRQLIVQETYEGTGGSVKAGTNIRADHNGRPIPDGTDMVNLVTLEREDASSAWKVTGNQVGYKPSCDVEKVS